MDNLFGDLRAIQEFSDGRPFKARPYVRALFEDLIKGAVADANGDPTSVQAVEARRFLLENEEWFPIVCSGAGINYGQLRAHLGTVIKEAESFK
jgi:hypothetical protein